MKMRSCSHILLVALASLLTISTVAYANDNASQHTGDCMVKSTFAKGMMENRLEGEEKSQALSATNGSEDVHRMMQDVVGKAYSYDIENGSIEDFREKVFSECMAES